MALQTPAITTTSVTKPQEGLFGITFRMVAEDNVQALPGLDVSFSINFKPGHNEIVDKENDVVEFFQEEIDRYQSRMVIATSVALATVRNSIASRLVVT